MFLRNSLLRKLPLPLFVAFALPAQAQPKWLTLTGNPGDAKTDIVEVDPESRSASREWPTLNIRANGAVLRTSTDGVPFRSITATVMVDCAAKSARFVSATFYMMPLWEGQPHKTLAYSSAELRPMQFRNVEPNPSLRIIRAACPNLGAVAG